MGTELQVGFSCTICGEHHEVLPLSYSVKAPMAASRIPIEELEQRIVISPDQCVIDGKDFYLRGRIAIPIVDLDEPFIWGVWAEVSPINFMRTMDLWMTPGRESEPPFPGWLDSEIPLYGNTINVEVAVQTQIAGRRPHFTIIDQDHALAFEQRNGLTLEEVAEIAAYMFHP